MAGWIKSCIIIAVSATPQSMIAQDIYCNGASPDWTLSITDTAATFTFDRKTEMQVMQDDVSKNDANVRAMTLVGPRDSAIVIYDLTRWHATILTQRGQSPIILSGSCI